MIEDLTTSAYLLPSLIAHCTESDELFRSSLRQAPGAILGDNRRPTLDLSGPDRGLCFTWAGCTRCVPGRRRTRWDRAPGASCRGQGDDQQDWAGAVVHSQVCGRRGWYLGLCAPRSRRWGLQRIVMTAALLHSAARIGAAERAIQMTREYTLSRHQFDVPIGSFQAVKHLLADALALKEVAWSAALSAAACPDPDAYRNLIARWLCLEAAMQASRTAAQLHGGIGFTWEFDLHFVLKTILDSSTRFGSTDSLSIAIADLFVERTSVPV